MFLESYSALYNCSRLLLSVRDPDTIVFSFKPLDNFIIGRTQFFALKKLGYSLQLGFKTFAEVQEFGKKHGVDAASASTHFPDAGAADAAG